MIPPPSLRLCGERGYFQAPSDRGLEVPPLFRTRTVLLSPALSLPKGGPHAGKYTTPGRGVNLPRGGRMGARTLATWPPAADAIPRLKWPGRNLALRQ